MIVKNIMKSVVKLTVLYDNNSLSAELLPEPDWGFACLIEFREIKILFDTGESGNILLNNMMHLKIDPLSINIVFLSHFHHDHTGGLIEFLKINPYVKIFYPQSFPIHLIDAINISVSEPFPVSEFQEILTDIYTLGEFKGLIPEQSLVLRNSSGIVVITGCAHPGIICVLENVKKFFPNETISFLIGGFHLHKMQNEERTKTINRIYEMEVQSIAPSHCTGDIASKMLKEKYGTKYLEIGVGKIVEI